MAEGNDFSAWYRSIPRVTRWWFTLCIAVPVLSRFGLLPGDYLILLFDEIFYRFQVRQLTDFRLNRL